MIEFFTGNVAEFVCGAVNRHVRNGLYRGLVGFRVGRRRNVVIFDYFRDGICHGRTCEITSCVAVNLRGVLGVIDKRIAVALNFGNFLVAADFPFRRGFFEVPLHKGGNRTDCVVALACRAVGKLQRAVVAAPTHLHVHKDTRNRAAVAFLRIKPVARRVTIVGIGHLVCRRLRYFFEAFVAARTVKFAVARHQVMSVRTGIACAEVTKALRPDVLTVYAAVEVGGNGT